MLRNDEWASAYGSIGTISTQLSNIPLDILDPWTTADGQPQPFRPYSEEKLAELAENIKKNGVIEPICVRPLPTGRYQIVAGHNRVNASRLAGLTAVPALVQQMTDDEAALRMVDSNLQHREQLLPSEKAYAYRERMNALKRIQRNNPVGKSRDLLAAEAQESATQIQRYIRLTYLAQFLLAQIDSGKLAIQAGVYLSYLSTADQDLLVSLIDQKQCKLPSIKQAKNLATSDLLDMETMLRILCPQKNAKKKEYTVPMTRISTLFPDDATGEQMETEIYNALIAYRKMQSDK